MMSTRRDITGAAEGSTTAMPTDPRLTRIPHTNAPTIYPAGRATAPAPIAGTQGTPSHMRVEQRRRRGRAPLIVLGVLAVLVIAVYAAGVVAFSQICYPNTQIADTDVSLMDRPTAAGRIQVSAKNYRLSVEGDGFSWNYEPENPEDIFDAEGAVDRVIAANEPFAWPVRLFKALTSDGSQATDGAPSAATTVKAGSASDAGDILPDLPESFDQKAFSDNLGQAVDAFNANRTGTFDAAGAYDAQAGAFTIDRAHANRKLDRDAITRTALFAVSTLTSKVTLDDASFTPLVAGKTDDQLKAACDAANALIGTNVNLKMGGATVATLDGATLAQWITFDQNLSPVLSTEPVTAWVAELAKSTLDTVGTDRTYTRPDGKTITVGGGTYGWTSNEAELVKMLQDAVANKQVGDIEIPTKHTAAKFAAMGQPDWGAYADVDLTEQHARYYDAAGNLVWESGIITGNPNKGNGTPTGIYQLNTNNGPSKLIGKRDPATGKPEYETPVNWWMPFVGNAIGFHDANWQASSSFSNPNAYKSVGSHGCINLPPSKAKELSGIIHVGDCVIVHY